VFTATFMINAAILFHILPFLRLNFAVGVLLVLVIARYWVYNMKHRSALLWIISLSGEAARLLLYVVTRCSTITIIIIILCVSNASLVVSLLL
jgi:hypothetical protein